MNALLSHPMAPVVLVAVAVLFLLIVWKVLKSTVKLFVAFVVVAAILAGVFWLRTH